MKILLNEILDSLDKHEKGFIVINGSNVSYSSGDGNIINAYTDISNLDDAIFSIYNATSSYASSYPITGKSAVVIVGEIDNTTSECYLLERLMRQADIEPKPDTISSIIGVRYQEQVPEKPVSPIVSATSSNAINQSVTESHKNQHAKNQQFAKPSQLSKKTIFSALGGSSATAVVLATLILTVSVLPTTDGKIINDLFIAAAFAEDDGRFEDAIINYKEIIQKSPNNQAAYVGKGEAELSISRIEDGKNTFQQVLNIDPNDISGHIGFFKISVGEQKYQDALDRLDKIDSIDPGNIVTASNRERVQVLEQIEMQIGESPSADLYVQKANILYTWGLFDSAKEMYKLAISEDENSINALVGLGNVEQVFWNMQESYDICQKAHELDEERAIPLICIANYHTKIRDYSDSIITFESVLDVHPEDTRALLGLGDVYMIMGDLKRAEYYYNEALNSYDKILSIEPNNIGALVGTGHVHYKQGDYDDALYYYDKVLNEIYAQNVPALLGKGFVFEELERHDEALSLYQKALEIEPRNKSIRMAINNIEPHLAGE